MDVTILRGRFCHGAFADCPAVSSPLNCPSRKPLHSTSYRRNNYCFLQNTTINYHKVQATIETVRYKLLDTISFDGTSEGIIQCRLQVVLPGSKCSHLTTPCKAVLVVLHLTRRFSQIGRSQHLAKQLPEVPWTFFSRIGLSDQFWFGPGIWVWAHFRIFPLPGPKILPAYTRGTWHFLPQHVTGEGMGVMGATRECSPT